MKKEMLIQKEGRLLRNLFSPLKPEFRIKDLLQVIIGATILAVPVGFTEETWVLGSELPLVNVLWIMAISIIFISSFVYYTYYRENLKQHKLEFLKRVLSTYILSFIVVGMLLYLIQKAPWQIDFLLSLKRTILVALPASMSAAIADTIK